MWCVTAACALPQPLLPVLVEPTAASSSNSAIPPKAAGGGRLGGGAVVLFPAFPLARRHVRLSCRAGRHGRRLCPVRMAPQEKKATRRHPLDFPIEWEGTKTSRRPDVFPKFSPMKTPLPPPLPTDPDLDEIGEEDEEELEEEEKKEGEEEENPENGENPEMPEQ